MMAAFLNRFPPAQRPVTCVLALAAACQVAGAVLASIHQLLFPESESRIALVLGAVTSFSGFALLYPLWVHRTFGNPSSPGVAHDEEVEKQLRIVTDNLQGFIMYLDREQRCLFANAYSRRVYGDETAPIVGRKLQDIVGNSLYEEISPYVEGVLTGKRMSFERSGMVNGIMRHYESNYIPDCNASGEVTGFFAISLDITERRTNEICIADSEERLRTITDNLPVVIAYIDRDHRYRFCNRTFEQWGGPSPLRINGMAMLEVLGKEAYALRIPYLLRAMDGERVEFEFEANGRHLQSVYIPHVSHEGIVLGIYTLTTNITRLKSIEHELQKMARLDALTGLINRYSLNEKLPEAMSRSKRTQLPMALMFLDIDHFKRINDAFGHAAGDQVLKEFAGRLKACVRSTDIVARFAGDEFIVILEGLHTLQEAEAISVKVIDTISAMPFQIGDHDSLHITTSIGIAMLYPDEEIEAPELLANADKALYEAKESGRNRLATAA